MKQKRKRMEQIKLFYLFIFIIGALIIVPTHIFQPPTFMYARFPHYLEMMGPFFGVNWPLTFEIYHYVLYLLAIVGSINVAGILFYPKFKKTAIASSLTGVILTAIMSLFLFFPFMKVDIPTSVTYGSYSVILWAVNLLTFRTLTAEQKEA
ncbi:MAG: hypothetical protein Q8P26_02360 [Candidatus Levybacteria bacterium]|nr:hypothetical protein [Candidatus Levybacteria bacterium]